jgi:hypothetical protein
MTSRVGLALLPTDRSRGSHPLPGAGGVAWLLRAHPVTDGQLAA